MRNTEKVLEAMPRDLRRLHDAAIEHILHGIRTYWPRRFDPAFFAKTTGLTPLFEQDYEAMSAAVLLPTQEYLDRGGKRLRPLLVALTLEAYGADPAAYEPLLGAIECMEDSSIMMDDYIDGSELRRGGPCAHRLHGFGGANIGACTGFAIAEYAFFNNELHLREPLLLDLLNALAWEAIQMAFGQIEELYWTENRINRVTVEQYLQETTARCAFLTFRGPLRYAGLIAGAPGEDIPVLERLGESLLIGYHLRGDTLDMVPDSEAWGKVAGEDITTGRRTLLINYLLQHADARDRQTLIDILNAHAADDDRKRQVYDMVLKYGGFAFSTRLAEEYNAVAKRDIDLLHIPMSHKTLLHEFAEFATLRRKV
ncbi:MAG: polyprenyl synthetase family protein [Lentisphaeria bacterium]|nr:polyprenyl synthetase family protein [Lentisphaeria bacterium]